MGQKANPISLRLSLNKSWDSKYQADKYNFSSILNQDLEIRHLIKSIFFSNAVILQKCVIKRIKSEIYIYVYYAQQKSYSDKLAIKYKRTSQKTKSNKGYRVSKYLLSHSNRYKDMVALKPANTLHIKALIKNNLILLLENTNIKLFFTNTFKQKGLNKKKVTFKQQRFIASKHKKRVKSSLWKLNKRLSVGKMKQFSQNLLSLFHTMVISRDINGFLDEIAKQLRLVIRKPQMFFNFFSNVFNIFGPKFNIKGIKLQFKGRFSNAKRTKIRIIKYGKIPLQSFTTPVLYGDRHVLTIYGVCSVRFWLYI